MTSIGWLAVKEGKNGVRYNLIVDDNPLNMKLIRVLLTAEGYQVSTAVDAKEALDTL